MTTIDNFNFAGKKAFVRVDFNVPLDENSNITDDNRIKAAMPTLKKIISDGGRLIIASHMGRPKKNPDPKYSLKQILNHVSKLLEVDVKFADDCQNAQDIINSLSNGQAVMLENLRFYAEEEGKPRGIDKEDSGYERATKEMKERQVAFTKVLAGYADCYVNDAFGTAHRKHASTAIIADYFDSNNKMFGYLMSKEVTAVDKVMNNIAHPFTAIMGGSKVSTKIEIIENLLTKVDNLILCGGMTYTFKKAMGGSIGNSLCEEDKLELALEIMDKAKKHGVNLILPKDSVIADDFSDKANTKVVDSDKIDDGWEGLDIGPETIKTFTDIIIKSKTILWNGPCGVFEMDKFAIGSKAIAEAIAEATNKGTFSLIGGGDSVACINKFGLTNQVSYVSTGGGALLEAIEGKILPGIAAIKK